MVDEFITNVLFLLDFNGLVVEADPDTPVESLQEISFYALLALINFTLDNATSQDFVAKHGAVNAILQQLKSGSYEPKKTACYCLNSVISNNDLNKSECIQYNGVPILCELINDEDDDALSEKAYECLENLGSEVMVKLLNKVHQVCELRKPVMWRG